MKLTKTLIALALAGAAFSAQAHKPWLLPSSSLVDHKDPWVTVDAAISEGLFDIDHVPLKLDGITITGPDGAKVDMQNAMTGRLRSTFDVKLAKPGTYRIALVNQSVMASWKVNGEVKRWRGAEAEMAANVPAKADELTVSRTASRLETFVSSNKTDEAVFKPTGVGLELVPVTHPNDMRAGEEAKWKFLLDGKPAANQAFSLIPGGVKYRGTLGEIRFNTDAKGEVSFTIPEAGMYLVSSSWPAAVAPQPGQPRQMPARRVTYAATVEVLPQ
ncbi:DUF4198 domain-containing protein [Pseudoduganella sp. DS3]|uniref:DUF4198 domain-containing protein n=1 Tax=Pseudoduganella guangdongensis TaxID=2692179 RepID=A0A6N9HPK7_9BURK|nr:DUF4198 domain-containing protein [Pseudoduganella guangdongensis]MYN05460.1 DUF4198 domain-containing protein [Pseudoduganella guangdongensis]